VCDLTILARCQEQKLSIETCRMLRDRQAGVEQPKVWSELTCQLHRANIRVLQGTELAPSTSVHHDLWDYSYQRVSVKGLNPSKSVQRADEYEHECEYLDEHIHFVLSAIKSHSIRNVLCTSCILRFSAHESTR
jgi:predicted RNA-binding protein